jgi:hypothetical protein
MQNARDVRESQMATATANVQIDDYRVTHDELQYPAKAYDFFVWERKQ